MPTKQATTEKQNPSTDTKSKKTEAISYNPAVMKKQIEELTCKLEVANKTVEENKEKMLRALATMENAEKRNKIALENAHKFGTKKLLEALVPVLDSLSQADTLPKTEGNSAMHEGVALTLKLFSDTLHKFGITEINPTNEAFDPNIHEAIAMQPSDEVKANHIIQVVQKGYLLNGRTIRASRVIVAKAK
ncbi:MAG: nucleotide exchange factor GrpE [Thiotrichales bacterium]|nr:MAG: nucleotide exchange factor GrpE [Thiotrichales bacterium]